MVLQKNEKRLIKLKIIIKIRLFEYYYKIFIINENIEFKISKKSKNFCISQKHKKIMNLS